MNPDRLPAKIATVAKKLPDDLKAAHPDIDWAGINRMRNLVAHHYDKVNDDRHWQALTTRIPDLVTRLTDRSGRYHACSRPRPFDAVAVGRPPKGTCRPIAYQ